MSAGLIVSKNEMVELNSLGGKLGLIKDSAFIIRLPDVYNAKIMLNP